MSGTDDVTTEYSRRRLLGVSLAMAGLASGVVSLGLPGSARAAPGEDFTFVDPAAASLQGVKRVAIASVVLAFQTEAEVNEKGGAFLNRNDTQAINALDGLAPSVMQALAEAAYQDLKAKLAARGLEVVDEAALKAQPAYQGLLQKSGFDSGAYWANADGVCALVAPASLPPYLPYGLETGNYEAVLVQKSITAPKSPGRAPTHVTQAMNWQTPGLEIDLAKALDAAVIKAWYVINFSELAAGSKIEDFGSVFAEGSVGFNASAKAFARLREEQSRISVRLAASDKKMGYRIRNTPLTFNAPAHDGDMTLSLAKPVAIGGEFFSVSGSDSGKGTGSLGLGPFGGARGQETFKFRTVLTDPAAYQARTAAAIASVQTGLVAKLFS